MIAAMDNTFLTLLLNPRAAARPNPATGKPAEHYREKIESLIDEFSSRGDTLIIPAPALSECLCATDSAEQYIAELASYSAIDVVPFGQAAAYELSTIMRKAELDGDKRSGEVGSWQHVKMDRMIVAIAVVAGAKTLYSDDTRQTNFAEKAGMSVIHTWDLQMSSKRAQGHLQDNGSLAWPVQNTPLKPTTVPKVEEQ